MGCVENALEPVPTGSVGIAPEPAPNGSVGIAPEPSFLSALASDLHFLHSISSSLPSSIFNFRPSPLHDRQGEMCSAGPRYAFTGLCHGPIAQDIRPWTCLPIEGRQVTEQCVQYSLILDQFSDQSDVIADTSLPHILLEDGNCGLLALACLLNEPARIAEAAAAHPIAPTDGERPTRTHRDLARLAGVPLEPKLDLPRGATSKYFATITSYRTPLPWALRVTRSASLTKVRRSTLRTKTYVLS